MGVGLTILGGFPPIPLNYTYERTGFFLGIYVALLLFAVRQSMKRLIHFLNGQLRTIAYHSVGIDQKRKCYGRTNG